MELQPTFDLLQSLSDSMQANGSCLPKEPFMKLEAGIAPLLRYNMPQKSGFTAYGHFVPTIPKDNFKTVALEIPANNFFEQISKQERVTIEKRLSEELLSGKQKNKLLPKTAAGVGKKNVKMVKMSGGTEKSANTGTGPTSEEPFICDIPFKEIVDNVEDGRMPYFYEGPGGYNGKVDYLEKPAQPIPTLFIIEEYTVASYLGDYGAGKTLRTMSLLPGEKTTITVRTYRESVTTQSRAENVLESFNEDSTREIEQTMEEEDSLNDSNATGTSHAANVQASASGKMLGITASVSGGYNFSTNNNSNRTANVRSLGRAVDKHVQNSNNHREITVNSTTQSTVTEGEEQTIVRELQNYNKSRVLNIVFRQLLQEYVTITYLSNIRIGFTNGYAETTRVVDLEELDTLLKAVIKDDKIEITRASILKHYCKVKSAATGTQLPFIESQTASYGECIPGYEGTETFWAKKAGTLDAYTGGGLSIAVPGIILNVQSHVLRTDSVVADALLGQGEALDCFNLRLQDAEAMKAHLGNAETLQRMVIVDGMETALDKATNYKKVFGDCCENPQTEIIP